MESGLIAESTDTLGDENQSLSYLLACVLAVVLGLVFSFGCFSGRGGDVAAVRLQVRINPNDAPVESLMRLPQIGRVRAERIIAYRQGHAADSPVFTCCDDLQKVNGIGRAVAGQLSDYLRFE